MFILSIDVGTSGAKFALLDEQLNIRKSFSSPYNYNVYNQDWVELDPELVLKALISGIKSFEGYLDKIDVIGFDTFSPSVVLMDKDGNLLHPIITHMDRRSKEQTKQILNIIGKERFQAITGIQPFTGGASVTTLMWMLSNRPDITKKAYKFGHLNTWVYHLLTGEWATDPTNASMTGLYSTIDYGGWSEKLCDALNIPPEILPDIHTAGTISGSLRKDFAKLSGLKESIPVVFGTNDVATSLIGADNEESGDVLIISGSSEMISIISDNPIVDDNYYLRASATGGKWQIYATTASGFVVDWIYKEFYREMDKDEFYNTELKKAAQNNIFGNIVQFHPYMTGDRQSLELKRGAFTGLTLECRRRDLLSAVLKGFHEPVINTIEIVKEFMELNDPIKLTGGMSTDYMLELKKKLIAGFNFENRADCSVLGCGKLVMNYLSGM